MSRRVVWVQLLIGWLPLWALMTALIVMAHGTSHGTAALVSLRMILTAALLGLVVQRVVERHPWQTPAPLSFMLTHLGFAILYAGGWLMLNSAVESFEHRALVMAAGPGAMLFMLTGVWFYVMIAGVSYTTGATERAANAEAGAARAKLAALRAQLNPHFLFNALHSVVQLIPVEPARAALAAEEVAVLLRSTIEEDRELVSLDEELAFVERYLKLERMRFGDRLRVRIDASDAARAADVPVFAVQTLVENAVRHGASPRIEPTEIMIRAEATAERVTITVADDGAGMSAPAAPGGSGLRRLRERLQALYGDAAGLEVSAGTPGFVATMTIPASARDE